jgi:HlyD family secretion protein
MFGAVTIFSSSKHQQICKKYWENVPISSSNRHGIYYYFFNFQDLSDYQSIITMKFHIISIISCLVATLLSSCADKSSSQSNAAAIPPAQPNAVIALGRVQPQGEVIKLSVANAQDSRVDRILIKEGDLVKSNQVIAILQGIDRKKADLRDALAEVKLRQVELAKVSQGDVKKAQIVAQNAVIMRLTAQLASTQKQRVAALVSSQARLRNAEIDYSQRGQLYQNGTGLLTAKAKLANASAEFARRRQFYRTGGTLLSGRAKLTAAQQQFDRQKSLYGSGAISKSQLEKAQEELTSAQAFVQEKNIDGRSQIDKAAEDLAVAQAALQEKAAENRLQLAKTAADLLANQETVKERRAELEQTQQTLAAEIRQEQAKLAELREVRPADVSIAQAQLEKAQIAVEQKQAAVRDSEVRVPVAGQILKINTRVGEQVNTGQGIVELAQTSQMYVVAEVAEADVGKIRAGQVATITSEYKSFEGELQGTVEQIGLQVGRKQSQEIGGSNRATDKEARVVAIQVRIAPNDSSKVAKSTNMQVRVRLPLKS